MQGLDPPLASGDATEGLGVGFLRAGLVTAWAISLLMNSHLRRVGGRGGPVLLGWWRSA